MKTVTFFCKVEHKHRKPVESLDYACTNKTIIYFTTHVRKSPINMLFRSKTLKTQLVEHCQNPTRKTSEVFSCHQPGRYVSTGKNFAFLGSFAKFPFLYIYHSLERAEENFANRKMTNTEASNTL